MRLRKPLQDLMYRPGDEEICIVSKAMTCWGQETFSFFHLLYLVTETERMITMRSHSQDHRV